MKNIIIFFALALFLFGCTVPNPNDGSYLEEFNEIKSTHGMENGFFADQVAMNSYLNELSELRGSILFGEAGNVVQAEIETATSFSYLIKALSESGSLDFYNINCNDLKIKNTVIYANNAIENSVNAERTISSLSDNLKENLRENQLEVVKEYKQNAEQIKMAINELC
jgi:hypothetical protein